MKTNEMLQELFGDCWVMEAWSEHPSDGNYYVVVKFSCGCEARGRYKSQGKDLNTCISEVYNEIKEEWGELWTIK